MGNQAHTGRNPIQVAFGAMTQLPWPGDSPGQSLELPQRAAIGDGRADRPPPRGSQQVRKTLVNQPRIPKELSNFGPLFYRQVNWVPEGCDLPKVTEVINARVWTGIQVS